MVELRRNDYEVSFIIILPQEHRLGQAVLPKQLLQRIGPQGLARGIDKEPRRARNLVVAGSDRRRGLIPRFAVLDLDRHKPNAAMRHLIGDQGVEGRCIPSEGVNSSSRRVLEADRTHPQDVEGGTCQVQNPHSEAKIELKRSEQVEAQGHRREEVGPQPLLVNERTDFTVDNLPLHESGDGRGQEIGTCPSSHIGDTGAELATLPVLSDMIADRQVAVLAPERLEETSTGPEARVARLIHVVLAKYLLGDEGQVG